MNSADALDADERELRDAMDRTLAHGLVVFGRVTLGEVLVRVAGRRRVRALAARYGAGATDLQARAEQLQAEVDARRVAA